MGHCESKMIFGFLDNIQKVLTYDLVAFSYITFSVIYKLFEWLYLSKNIKVKIDLQFSEENKCPACKNKELSPRLPPRIEEEKHSISPIKSPFRNVSKLKMHFLRKIFENLMISFPKIVQRSVEMYNKSCQISPNCKGFSLCTEPYMGHNGSKLAPKLKRDIPLQNVTPSPKKTIAATEYCSNTVPRKVPLPIAHKSYYKKSALSMNFRRSKRESSKGTDLPIGTILHFGIKIKQTLSPAICIDKSHMEIKNNRTTNYKIQKHILESENIEGSAVERTKLQTTDINNKVKGIEKHESNGITIPKSQDSQITKHIYCNPLQEPHFLPNALVDDQHVSTGLVREVIYSCSTGKTSTRRFHRTVSDKPSIVRLHEAFICFKRFFVNITKPYHLLKRLLRGRTTEELCQGQLSP
ncbi:uncharacterized protein LOC143775278 [Ranitomeya variabilis]|uniref:uncharacterized protein LOC143775278 n=1 Tax=Ranitomeya variabilis TaxID=490064 RepID=UPI004056CF50